MPGYDVWRGRIRQHAGSKYAEGDPMIDAEPPDWLPEELRPFNVVRLSQSFIEGWRKCPRSAVAEKRPTYGEAAAAGIVAHSIVDGRVARQVVDPVVDEEFRQAKMTELASQGWAPDDAPGFLAKAHAYAEVFTAIYLEKYHQFMPNLQTEASGTILFDMRDNPRTSVDFILITGTADLVYTMTGGWTVGVDWKSGSKMPEPWTVQRYGVQWRIYSVMFGLDEMIFEYPMALNPLNGNKGDWVANRYNGIVHVRANFAEREAYRRQLEDECGPIASRLLASVDYRDHDPRPTDWHCGKWCNVFLNHECVGADTNVAWVAKMHSDAESGGVQSIPLRGE